jgi:hypothetical protein
MNMPTDKKYQEKEKIKRAAARAGMPLHEAEKNNWCRGFSLTKAKFIIEKIMDGKSRYVAAGLHRCPPDRLDRWMNDHPTFGEAIISAEAHRDAALEDSAYALGIQNGEFALKLLAKLRPQDYSDKLDPNKLTDTQVLAILGYSQPKAQIEAPTIDVLPENEDEYDYSDILES